MKPTSMFIGVAKVWFEIPECRSLKEKRSVLKSLLVRIRERFHVAASEIGYHDSSRQAAVGISIIGNHNRHVESCLAAVIDSFGHEREVRVINYKTEILKAGGVDLMTQLDSIDDNALRAIEREWMESDEEDRVE